MNFFVGHSKLDDVDAALKEATSSFNNPDFLFYFSPLSKIKEVTEKIYNLFPNATCLGTSSHYVYSKSGLQRDVISCFGFKDEIETSSDIILEIDRYPLKYAERVENAIKKLSSPENTICIELSTAFSMSEELLLTTLNSVCSKYNIPVAGGNAGLSPTELKNGVRKTYVGFNGKVYENACVFAMLKNQKSPIRIYDEHFYKPTGIELLITAIDIKNKTVLEINNMPAAEGLAKVLKCSIDEIPQKMNYYQFGKYVDGKLLISSFGRMFKDGSLEFNAHLFNQTKVMLLEPDDMKTIFKNTFNKIKTENPHRKIGFLIHCQGRSMFLDEKNMLEDYAKDVGKLFPYFGGFSSLGEQYKTLHLNHTMVMVVF